MSDDQTTPAIDRRTLLKRAAIGAAAAGTVPLTRTSGSWAGLTRPAAMRPIRIGNLLTLTGPSATQGLELKKGFVTYVLAHDHRLGGRKIQFFDADDGGNPALGIQGAQKLINEDHVDFIEGILLSNVLLAVRDTIDSLKVPTVVANAGANAITRDKRSAYIFRTAWTNWQYGWALSKWAAKHYPDKMVVVAANFAAGQEQSSSFTENYKKYGGSVVGDTIFTPFPTAQDYQPYISQIQDRGPKAVYIFASGGSDAIRFVQQYAQFGLNRQAQLIGAPQLTDPQSELDAEGSAALGVKTAANWNAGLKNAENKKFIAAFKRFGQKPSSFAECGYNAAQYLDVVLRKLHGDISSKPAILKAMANPGPWQSPAGQLRMDPVTHQVNLPFYLVTVVKQGNGYVNKLTATLGRVQDPGS
jgi:branched-chain amino acid transport system substrate-binding protein